VFQIERGDTLTWEQPGERLRIRDLACRGSEIILERLDDLDAPTLSLASVTRHDEGGDRLPVIEVGDGRYLEVPFALLPTGDDDVDRQLGEIERAIELRRTLPGPSHGTSEALRDCARRLDALLGRDTLSSFIWIIVLREEIRRIAGRMV
jgi:hypothetical protein